MKTAFFLFLSKILPENKYFFILNLKSKLFDQIASNVFIVHIDQYFDIIDDGEESREFTVTLSGVSFFQK